MVSWREREGKTTESFSEIKEKGDLVRVLSVWSRLKHYTCQAIFLGFSS
jgi:hypothetical protein